MKTKYPIILVHGIVVKDFKKFKAFGKIEKILKNEGFIVYTATTDGFGTIENNAIVLSDGNRLVLKRNDRYESYFINVLFSEITECYYKISEGSSEFILNIQNIYYRITVLN